MDQVHHKRFVNVIFFCMLRIVLLIIKQFKNFLYKIHYLIDDINVIY